MLRCNLVAAQLHPHVQPVFTAICYLLAVRSSVFLFVDHFNADTLQVAKSVKESHDVLVDLFERIQFFLKRLGVYTQISPTSSMVEILVKIMAEVISVLAIATQEMQQNRGSRLFLQDLLNLVFNSFHI